MEFRLLGSLEASSVATRADLGAPKQRALLAVLLLHVGELVSTERLIELLWGDHPPRTAAHSIQIYVSELRKALEPLAGRAVIVTRAPGYTLQRSPETIDAHRFEKMVRDGTGRLASDPREGARLLRGALALWRGPALADFTFEEFAKPYIRRLNDLHIDAIGPRDCGARDRPPAVSRVDARGRPSGGSAARAMRRAADAGAVSVGSPCARPCARSDRSATC